MFVLYFNCDVTASQLVNLPIQVRRDKSLGVHSIWHKTSVSGDAKTFALRINVFLEATLETVCLRKLVSSSEKFLSKSRQTGEPFLLLPFGNIIRCPAEGKAASLELYDFWAIKLIAFDFFL